MSDQSSQKFYYSTKSNLKPEEFDRTRFYSNFGKMKKASYVMTYRNGCTMFFSTGIFFNTADPFTNQAVPKAHNAVVSKIKVL